jgi:hypothetical protein
MTNGICPDCGQEYWNSTCTKVLPKDKEPVRSLADMHVPRLRLPVAPATVVPVAMRSKADTNVDVDELTEEQAAEVLRQQRERAMLDEEVAAEKQRSSVRGWYLPEVPHGQPATSARINTPAEPGAAFGDSLPSQAQVEAAYDVDSGDA